MNQMLNVFKLFKNHMMNKAIS